MRRAPHLGLDLALGARVDSVARVGVVDGPPDEVATVGVGRAVPRVVDQVEDCGDEPRVGVHRVHVGLVEGALPVVAREHDRRRHREREPVPSVGQLCTERLEV
eukprot:7386002-Prymnesium_polylepis.3